MTSACAATAASTTRLSASSATTVKRDLWINHACRIGDKIHQFFRVREALNELRVVEDAAQLLKQHRAGDQKKAPLERSVDNAPWNTPAPTESGDQGVRV